MPKNAGFTLVEALVSAVVAALIFFAAWSIYVLGWTWWYEVSPRGDAQRIARLAIERIAEGVEDPTAGTDMIGSTSYGKRNGIAGTYYFSPTLVNTYVNSEGTTVSNEIDYGLYQDYPTRPPTIARNVRSFYLGTDPGTGQKAVYYKGSDNVSGMVRGTLGITNLEFSFYVDKSVSPNVTYKDIVLVSVSVERDVSVAGHTPYHIRVHYGYDDSAALSCGNTVYLRNAPQ